VETVINGENKEFLCDANQSMLDVLRDELGLTGTKEGCGTGDCGACSILVDGRLVCSCLMLGVESGGKSVETIEGIAGEEGLHTLQRQFLENAALQCGICTPGFIVASKALLEKNPNPDEETIRYWLAGNLCRCTGYDKIVRAVQDAAAEMSHPA
jgi:carbon-monoxide dehydrogenase small subunit